MIQSIEEGRKLDGNRSIAEKIKSRLNDLSKSSSSNQGRWIWELIQNAKDSVANENESVDIIIEIKTDSLKFMHNGAPFTELDVRGLINQISSKELDPGKVRRKSGRFGTGFLTTHLLSKKIDIAGVVKTDENKQYSFDFTLDRDSQDVIVLAEKVEESWKRFQETTKEISISELGNHRYTSFTYKDLGTDELAKVEESFESFDEMLPYVLLFVNEINSVQVKDLRKKLISTYSRCDENIDNNIFCIKIEGKEEPEYIYLLYEQEGNLTVATRLYKNEGRFTISDIQNFPKLFCDFPLIGSDSFTFPTIVNSPDFTPLTEREGIWLSDSLDSDVIKNKSLIEDSLNLYQKLLNYISQEKFQSAYNVVNTEVPAIDKKQFDSKWYTENIQKSLQEIINGSKIVECEGGVQDYKELKDVCFSLKDQTREEREEYWKYCKDLNVSNVPIKEDLHKWSENVWPKTRKCNINRLLEDFQKNKNLTELKATLNLDESKTIDWLNNFIRVLMASPKARWIFNNNNLLPDQTEDGTFNNRVVVRNDDIIVTKQPKEFGLKEIHRAFGKTMYSFVLRKDVDYKECHLSYSTELLAKLIVDLYEELETSGKRNPNAVRMLLEWFEHNPEEAKKYFPSLYFKRQKMFVDTIEDMDSLYSIMKANTPLSEINKLINDIESDPLLKSLIDGRRQELREIKENTIIGENIESLLKEILVEAGIVTDKVWLGRDLVIKLSKSGSEHFNYDIEVKSTIQESYVHMTPNQARTAVFENPSKYALCVVYKNGDEVNKDYVRANAKFVISISEELKEKVHSVEGIRNQEKGLADNNDFVDMKIVRDLEYRYGISNTIWSNGIDFESFVQFIKSKIQS